MQALLDEFEAAYDLIIIDTAPMNLVSDGITLLSKVTGVLVIGRIGAVTIDQARQLGDLLRRTGGLTFGVVANVIDRTPTGSYGYGGRYGYGGQHSNDELAKTNGRAKPATAPSVPVGASSQVRPAEPQSSEQDAD